MKSPLLMSVALLVSAVIADPVKPDDLAVWKLAPRTPWVTTAREIINLGGPGAGWKATFVKAEQGEFLKMAGAAKVYRFTDPEVPADAKWVPVDLPLSTFVSSHWKLDTGYYERTVILTAAQAKRNVRISFERIGVHYKVWVNGQLAVDEPLSSTFLEQHDISAFVKPGENVIRILVGKVKGDDDSWIDWPLNGAKTGIVRPFYLELRDPVAIERVAVRTVLTPEKRMTAVVTVTNTTGKAATRELKGAVAGTPWTASAKVTLQPGEGRMVELAKDWPDAHLWSPADPHLEFLDLTLTGDGATDAYRQRFGFREIRWSGTDRKALFNGKPFTMLRNSTHHFNLDREANRRQIALFKSRGIVGFRSFTDRDDLARFCDLCDEEGFLVSAAACSGWGCGFKTDLFFPRWKRMLGKMVEESMNSPAVVCWGLSNEFGTVYGGKDNMENAVKQGEVGEWVQAKDPTRPWEMYGEIELRWKGVEGPMPIRSYHYPFPVSKTVLPQGGRWYADGKSGWQGVFTNDKPVSVSEDLFHGFQDHHATMAKALVGDQVYTLDGYVAAQWYGIRKYWEGYALGNLAGWDPWCFYVQEEKSLLYKDPRGSPHPSRFLMLKEFYRNVTAGTTAPYTLIAVNRGFAPLTGSIARELRMGGKVVSTAKTVSAEIDNGSNVAFPIDVAAPSVTVPTPFEVIVTLTDAKGRLVDRETFEFTSVPAKGAADIRVPGATAAIVTRPCETLTGFTFAKGIHTTVTDALAAQPKAIVLYGGLSTSDALALDAWVKTGGRVLQLEPESEDWSVARLGQSHMRPYSFAFRRDDGRMTDLPDRAMRLWAPDGYVGDTVFQKPSENARVLWESVQEEGGLRWAEIAWFWRGKGGWLVSTVPVLERLGVEPMAGHVLQSVLNELTAADVAAPEKAVVLVDFDGPGPLDELLRKGKAVYSVVDGALAGKSDRLAETVYLVDAKGAALSAEAKSFIESVARKGGTVAVFGLAKETDEAFLKFLGISWEKPLEKVMAPIPWNPSKLDEVDTSRHFFTHLGNAGAMAGINNEDLFWWKADQMWVYYRFALGDPHFNTVKSAGEPVSAYFESADRATQVLTAPGAIGLKTVGKGRVLFSTVDVGKKGYAGDHPDKVYLTVKTLVNYLGAALSAIPTPAAFEFVDLAPVATASSWRKPGVEALAFVPKGVDYRYFPVNRCGWSVTVQNMCPAEPLPAEPLRFNGISFKFVDPDRNGGKDLLFLKKEDAPGRVTVKLPAKTTVSKVHFLGFLTSFDGGSFAFGDQETPVKIGVFNHVGNWADEDDHIKTGVKAYEGRWDVPPSDPDRDGKAHKAFVYSWTLENPDPATPIDHLDFVDCKNIGIFALTLEK